MTKTLIIVMDVKLPNKVPDKIGANMIHCITAFPAVKYSGCLESWIGRHRNDRLCSRDIQLSKYLRKGEKVEESIFVDLSPYKCIISI